MIPPIVGRPVWFWPETPSENGQPQAATIVCVNDDGTVHLSVMTHSGRQYAERAVILSQPEDARPAGRHCEWMP
jgi:hypothetical protein